MNQHPHLALSDITTQPKFYIVQVYFYFYTNSLLPLKYVIRTKLELKHGYEIAEA